MTTAQVSLTEKEEQAIAALSLSQGMSIDEILHTALEQFLSCHEPEFRRASLQQACGLWRDRSDVPDPEQLRKEWERT